MVRAGIGIAAEVPAAIGHQGRANKAHVPVVKLKGNGNNTAHDRHGRIAHKENVRRDLISLKARVLLGRTNSLAVIAPPVKVGATAIGGAAIVVVHVRTVRKAVAREEVLLPRQRREADACINLASHRALDGLHG